MSTVLVVDDDPGFLNAMVQMLATAGYRVLQAADGKQAVELLEQKHREIDLAIVDLALPGINGFEIIGAISRRPNAVRVIATTGLYNDFYLEMAESLGAHAVIRKPPQGKMLPEGEWLATIRQLIGKAAREKSAGVGGSRGTGDDAKGSNGTEADD